VALAAWLRGHTEGVDEGGCSLGQARLDLIGGLAADDLVFF
jgi:hypothetical protein